MKTALKKVLNETNKEKASEMADKAFSTIDKGASKGVIHKNKAANQKAKISKHIKNIK